jgi:hypothetical protein
VTVSNPDKHRELTLCEGMMSGDFTIRVGTPERIEWDASNDTVPTSVPVGGTIVVGANEHVRIEGLISLYSICRWVASYRYAQGAQGECCRPA